MNRHPIKTFAIALSIAALGLAARAETAPAAPAVAEAPAGTATLTLTFAGIKTTTGALMVALYDSPEAYDGGKAARQTLVPATAETVTTTIEGLAPGAYGIKLFHDVDGNGKMGANPFGMPTEPYAFSNDARGSMGAPKWPAATFEVTAGDNAQTIHID